MIESAKRRGFGAAQLLSLALILVGLYGMYREPMPTSAEMVVVHKLHYLGGFTVFSLGLLFYNPGRLVKGLTGVAKAWKERQ